MKKIIIVDYRTTEIHIYTLPKNQKAEDFVKDKFSEQGMTFQPGMSVWMEVDLDQSEGRLPIYIHE